MCKDIVELLKSMTSAKGEGTGTGEPELAVANRSPALCLSEKKRTRLL